jgi:hypothetical protein
MIQLKKVLKISRDLTPLKGTIILLYKNVGNTAEDAKKYIQSAAYKVYSHRNQTIIEK